MIHCWLSRTGQTWVCHSPRHIKVAAATLWMATKFKQAQTDTFFSSWAPNPPTTYPRASLIGHRMSVGASMTTCSRWSGSRESTTLSYLQRRGADRGETKQLYYLIQKDLGDQIPISAQLPITLAHGLWGFPFPCFYSLLFLTLNPKMNQHTSFCLRLLSRDPCISYCFQNRWITEFMLEGTKSQL